MQVQKTSPIAKGNAESSETPIHLVKGLHILPNHSSRCISLAISIRIINGKTMTANPQMDSKPCHSVSIIKIQYIHDILLFKFIFSVSNEPIIELSLVTIPETAAKLKRIPTIMNALTPTLFETAVSTGKVCEKDIITASMVTCFGVNPKGSIAANAAYIFIALPNTKGTAASPGRPNNLVSGSK